MAVFGFTQPLSGSTESKIVPNNRIWPDWHLAWIGQIELAKHDLLAPDLAKKVFEDVDRQLFAGQRR
jgi:hypothetical protein